MRKTSELHSPIDGHIVIPGLYTAAGGETNFSFGSPSTHDRSSREHKPFSTVPFAQDPDFVDRSSIMASLCKRCSQALALNDKYIGRIVDKQGTKRLQYDSPLTSETSLVHGTLPDLPRIQESGHGPSRCDFCRLLRKWILEYFTKTQPATLERRISVAYLIGRDTYPEYRKEDPYPGLVALRISLNPPGVEKKAPHLFLPVDAEGPCATFLGIQPPVKSALDKAGLETLCRNMEKQQGTVMAMKASKSESDPTGRSWFVPSRLLKLEPETGHGNLRLVSKQEISKKEQKEVRYAALSYCWGSSSHAATQTVTKRTTLGQRQRGISDSELTAVIRDTVKVCRVIGLHYLWVDALCT